MQFCELLPPDLITIQEIKDFFSSTWAPIVVQLHTAGEGILTDFLQQLTHSIANMPPNEVYSFMYTCMHSLSVPHLFFMQKVLQMVRSCVVRRGKEREPSVALYMPGVREYVSGEFNEKEVKDAIKRVGGTINDSGLFLRPASELV